MSGEMVRLIAYRFIIYIVFIATYFLWVESSQAGCSLSTRNQFLADTSLIKPILIGCQVVSGQWIDPWTGDVITSAKDADIERVVPLNKATASGGYAWSAETRWSFNDDPLNLVVVSRSNRSGRPNGAGPDKWVPPSPELACWFVARWEAIKTRWKLTISAEEADAIRRYEPVCGR
jgi:hypothetical protein